MNLDRVIAVRNTKTVYHDGDKCIKVFNENFSKSDVLNEALNQARIEELGLRIPKILEVSMVDGKWAIVSQFIKGKTLSQLMKEEPNKKDEYIDMLVDLQLEVQSKTCPLLNKLKDKMNYKIMATDLDATTRYDLHTRLEGMPKHNKVCHGDFCPSNVIVTDDGTPYIIDWAHATQGNASADAATTYLTFVLRYDKAMADEYLKLFCQKSKTAMQYVQKWMPIVAASHLLNSNETEKELLLNWVNVVEYE
ncbi:MAG: phosphotransferase [Clostridia bacterium]|nr:phosphotransferase [Clostridia bacterium]